LHKSPIYKSNKEDSLEFLNPLAPDEISSMVNLMQKDMKDLKDNDCRGTTNTPDGSTLRR
jgi:hypothetical protein